MASTQRIPRNRYAHVQGVIDTGPTLAKQRSLSSSEYVRRRDEVNYRITRGQLADLFNEYLVQEYETIGDQLNSGNPPKIVTHDYQDDREYDAPYLILDGRSKEEFDVNHIVSAHSYPYVFMKRDVNPPLFSRYRNVDGCLIIIYCDDERTSRLMAQTFVDRGTENIFLLNGGFLSFAAAFPSYVEGKMPTNLPPSPKSKMSSSRTAGYLTKKALDRIPEAGDVGSSPSSRRMMGDASQGMRGTRGRVSYLNKMNLRRLNGGDDRSEKSMSERSNRSLAETIISRATSRRGKVSMV